MQKKKRTNLVRETLFSTSGFITGRSEGLERVAFLCRSNVGVVTKTLQLLNMEENKEKSVGIIGGTQKMGLDSLMDLYFVYKPKYERRVS